MDSKTRVPDCWKVARLANVAEVVMGQSPPGSTVSEWEGDSRVDTGLPFIQGNAEFGDIFPQPAKWCGSPVKIAERGDILISVRAPVGAVNRAGERTAIGRGLAAIRFTSADSHFGWHIVNHAKHELERVTQGSTFQAIGGNELRSLSVFLPPRAEQRAIAAVLDSIDEAIERTEAVITATERLRDALLHELLTRGVPGWHSEWKEAPGIGKVPACWEVVRLGDVCEVKGGKRLPKGSSFADKDTGLPYIRVVDFSERTVDASDIQYLDPDIQQTISRYTIGSSDVYISIAGTIGLVGLVPSYLDGANLTENAAKIVILNPKGHSNYFLMSFLDSHAGKSQISLRVNVLGQPKLALERIRTIALPTPSFQEQRAIAEALSRIDDAVERGRIEMKVLQSVKASATDALLTGRVRVRNHNV